MDFTTYDDEQLDRLRIDVLNEQERRQRLADVPAQVADLARRYKDAGGDPAADLAEAIVVPDPIVDPEDDPTDEPDPEDEA